MPHLLNFIQNNGTLDSNDHTVLISHTGGGILSSLTGLYPDRHGQAVSNSYGYFRPDGSVGFSSSFKYWTDNTDGGNAANSPPTPSADSNFNMVNADPPSLGGTGSPRNTPAPWVPYTRAGCDVGGVGLANIEQENNTSIVLRTSPAPTSLASPAAIGDTNIKVNSVNGLAAGQVIVLDNAQAANELATIASVGTAGAGGTGVTLTAPLAKAHPTGAQVNVTAPDPTGDMTKVFGVGSPEWNEGRASQIAPGNTAARALAQTDFVGIAIHCASGGGICNDNSANARPDQLPDESGGYNGFEGLFGAKYVDPAINSGSGSVGDVVNNQPINDPFGQPGFPGFDGMLAKNTLGYVAQMQESGVPVTFGYISDAHDFHGVSGNDHRAFGPGEAGYVQQLRDYDQAFEDFFSRLQGDGINKNNTLFVVTVEEGDHFAGTPPDGPCDGVTTPCTYNNGHVTEVNGDLKRLVATYNAANGTSATTNFSVHSDMAPNVYITGNPARDSTTTRSLEQAMSNMNVTNPLSGVHEPLFVAMADPVRKSSSTWSRPIPHGRRRSRRSRQVTTSSALPRHPDTVRGQRPLELRLPAEHGSAEPDVRLEPRRGPARGRIDVAGPGRSGSRQEREAQRRLLLRSHRRPPDDARADRPEGLLRVRRPRADGAREGGVAAVAEDGHADAGARPGVQADQCVVRPVRARHARGLDCGPRQQFGG